MICSVTGNRGRPDSSNRPHPRRKSNPRPLIEIQGSCRKTTRAKMVAGTGIEPACVAYETTEEPLLNPAAIWSGRRDFNPRSPVPETGALSTRPLPEKLVGMRGFEPPPPCPQDRWAPVTLHPENLERSAGIEPAPRHWQCRILPLNHDRSIWWRRRGMIPRCQFAGLESSQLDDAP